MRQGINDWLSIIIKLMIIGAVLVAGLWIGISVYGNIVEVDTTPPDITEAPYVFSIKNTGQQILTNDYSVESDGRYTLNGYFEFEDNKWRWRDSTLTLDSYYFGDIIITRRR